MHKKVKTQKAIHLSKNFHQTPKGLTQFKKSNTTLLKKSRGHEEKFKRFPQRIFVLNLEYGLFL